MAGRVAWGTAVHIVVGQETERETGSSHIPKDLPLLTYFFYL